MKNLKTNLVMTVFLAASTNVFSAADDWTYITTTGGTQVFVNPKTFKKEKDIWKITILGDGTPYETGGYDGIPVQVKTSNSFDIEFDCSRAIFKIIKVASFSKHLGEGYIETKYIGGNWRSIYEDGIIFTPVAVKYCNEKR